MNLKKCSLCKELKLVELFSNRKGSRDGKRGECKKCEYTRQVQWKLNNKHLQKKLTRTYRLKHKYKITDDYFEQMKLEQNSSCKICLRSDRVLFIDHCHTTGKVRGLLCPSCNTLLGHIENKEKMKRIHKYLNEDKIT